MLTREENELLTRTGPGTPMGMLMRRYWIPALFSDQIAEPDGAPVRVKLLGERLVAFRDTAGRVGALGRALPAPHGIFVLWPQRGMRLALRLSRLEIRTSRAIASISRASPSLASTRSADRPSPLSSAAAWIRL